MLQQRTWAWWKLLWQMATEWESSLSQTTISVCTYQHRQHRQFHYIHKVLVCVLRPSWVHPPSVFQIIIFLKHICCSWRYISSAPSGPFRPVMNKIRYLWRSVWHIFLWKPNSINYQYIVHTVFALERWWTRETIVKQILSGLSMWKYWTKTENSSNLNHWNFHMENSINLVELLQAVLCRPAYVLQAIRIEIQFVLFGHRHDEEYYVFRVCVVCGELYLYIMRSIHRCWTNTEPAEICVNFMPNNIAS